MKKLLCRFANWILRKYTKPTITFNDKVYINGKTYTLVKATTKISPHAHTVINLEVIDGNPE